jgi:hypothetical protein
VTSAVLTRSCSRRSRGRCKPRSSPLDLCSTWVPRLCMTLPLSTCTLTTTTDHDRRVRLNHSIELNQANMIQAQHFENIKRNLVPCNSVADAVKVGGCGRLHPPWDSRGRSASDRGRAALYEPPPGTDCSRTPPPPPTTLDHWIWIRRTPTWCWRWCPKTSSSSAGCSRR